MKIAIIYNRDSQKVINLFGTPSREKYGLETIGKIKHALETGGHQVIAFEGDKDVIHKLEEFMPAVISGEYPGLVLNLSYGIQGRARYAHIPGILEMLGIPYVGSGPESHVVAQDKVMTKIVLIQKGLPTPRFALLENPEFSYPLNDDMDFPLIVKPKNEAVSFGLKIVKNLEELREGVREIHNMYCSPALVEEYIEGREINVGLVGNDPVQALPPVELVFPTGEKVYTYEDKMCTSGRLVEKICPAALSREQTEQVQELAISAFKALGCSDSARVDIRLDARGNPFILEVNSMASLNPDGSYVFAAEKIGMDYAALTNHLIEVARRRYFGPSDVEQDSAKLSKTPAAAAFRFLTQNRDRMEEELKNWTNMPSWFDDRVGIGAVVNKFTASMQQLGMEEVEEFTNRRSVWFWQTRAGFEGGALLVVPVDIPGGKDKRHFIPFRRDPEGLYGEGIASSRACIVCILQALAALDSLDRLHPLKIGMFLYADESRGLRYSSPLLQKAATMSGQVLVIQPGCGTGGVVEQRWGSQKISILAEEKAQAYGSTQKNITLPWFFDKCTKVEKRNRPGGGVQVLVQSIDAQPNASIYPARVRASLYISTIKKELGEEMEKEIRRLFRPARDERDLLTVLIEKTEERPPMIKNINNEPIIRKLKALSEEWKLPFGVETSPIPSAAGIVPSHIPVVCGLGPASVEMQSPYEGIQRGDLLRRTLLLTLFLLD